MCLTKLYNMRSGHCDHVFTRKAPDINKIIPDPKAYRKLKDLFDVQNVTERKDHGIVYRNGI